MRTDSVVDHHAMLTQPPPEFWVLLQAFALCGLMFKHLECSAGLEDLLTLWYGMKSRLVGKPTASSGTLQNRCLKLAC